MPENIEQIDTEKRLDEDFKNAEKIPFNPQEDKFIIFNDLHMGSGNLRTDAFKHNENLVCLALEHYLEQNYKLVLAGDIEDVLGWPRIKTIIDEYKGSFFGEEKKFVNQNRHFRVVGNHDQFWLKEEKRKKYLEPILGDIPVPPALVIGDKIVVVHGHQGTAFSDIGNWFSNIGVWINKKIIQPIFGRKDKEVTVRKDYKSRDRYLSGWAAKKKMILIAGHTHRAVFNSVPTAMLLKQKMEGLKTKLEDRTLKDQHEQFEQSLVNIERFLEVLSDEFDQTDEASAREIDPNSCYFNTGCCIYRNGITGIEIVQGEIRIVAWKTSGDRLEELAGDASKKAKIGRESQKITGISESIDEILKKTKDKEASIL